MNVHYRLEAERAVKRESETFLNLKRVVPPKNDKSGTKAERRDIAVDSPADVNACSNMLIITISPHTFKRRNSTLRKTSFFQPIHDLRDSVVFKSLRHTVFVLASSVRIRTTDGLRLAIGDLAVSAAIGDRWRALLVVWRSTAVGGRLAIGDQADARRLTIDLAWRALLACNLAIDGRWRDGLGDGEPLHV